MKRKMLSFLVTFALTPVLVMGCGSSENATKEDTAAAPQASTQAPASADTAKEAATEAATEADTEAAAAGTELKTALFSVSYSDDWAINEDDTSDSDDYCYADLTIPDGDSSLVECTISASVESPSTYRNSLNSSGIDAYQLVEEKSIETDSIGGIELVHYESTSWGEPVLYYLGRDEAAGTTVNISVYGDFEDTRVTDLLHSITFTLTDTGNVDPPWPWNGEPWSTEKEHTYGVGSLTVTSEWLKLEEPVLSDDIFSGRVEVTGDTVWILSDDVLYAYTYSDGVLTYESEMDLKEEGDYEELSSDESGRLYVTGFMERMLVIEDGEIKSRIDGVDVALMHESGTWGVGSFYGDTVKKVKLNGDSASLEEWPLKPAEETAAAFISKNHVYVSGTSSDKDNETVWVFDTDGNPEYEFGNASMGEPGWMGSVTDVAETENGFIVLDGNMRCLFFYDTDGSLIATVEADELFGSSYPWISSAAKMSDGSVLVCLVDERADESADELVVFRLSGY